MSLKKKTPRDIPENSSMVNDEHDLNKHSKVMENMMTNAEVEKKDQHPDPKQYENLTK